MKWRTQLWRIHSFQQDAGYEFMKAKVNLVSCLSLLIKSCWSIHWPVGGLNTISSGLRFWRESGWPNSRSQHPAPRFCRENHSLHLQPFQVICEVCWVSGSFGCDCSWCMMILYLRQRLYEQKSVRLQYVGHEQPTLCLWCTSNLLRVHFAV